MAGCFKKAKIRTPLKPQFRRISFSWFFEFCFFARMKFWHERFVCEASDRLSESFLIGFTELVVWFGRTLRLLFLRRWCFYLRVSFATRVRNLSAPFVLSSGVRSQHATKGLLQRTFTSVSIAPELLVLRVSMQLNTPHFSHRTTSDNVYYVRFWVGFCLGNGWFLSFVKFPADEPDQCDWAMLNDI